MLRPETDPDQASRVAVVRRDEYVMARRAGLDPSGGCVAVPVAKDLGIVRIDPMPGALDPDVGSPVDVRGAPSR